jgi:2-polyprenyl-3-methyl-5-hydroxy-6-metoxy-1,4-benzoquinol methylase
VSDDSSDPRERNYKRIRKFYEISAEREWARLEQPVDGRLEFAVNRAWITRYLPAPPARILDIGGGPGRYSIWLAGRGYRVTLADLSPALLDVARAKSAEEGVQIAEIVETNATDLSRFDDASFDAVLCMGPLYHLIDEADRRRVIQELLRVLTPGGHAFVAFLNRMQTLRVAVNQDIPFFTPYTFDIIKKYHDEGILDWPIPGTFNLAYLYFPKDITPFSEFLWADFLRRKITRKSVEENFDQIESLDLSHSELRALHSAIIDAHAHGNAGDRLAAIETMRAAGLGEAWEHAVGLIRRIGMWPALEEAGLDDARDAFAQALHLQLSAGALHKELRAAEAALATDPTDENLRHFVEIQAQFRDVQTPEALIEGFGVSSGRATRSF